MRMGSGDTYLFDVVLVSNRTSVVLLGKCRILERQGRRGNENYAERKTVVDIVAEKAIERKGGNGRLICFDLFLFACM